MANTVPMKAPAGFTGTVSVNVSTPPSSGQTYTPDANGLVLVDPRDVIWMTAQGFTNAQVATQAAVAAADNGTTQTLTAAMMTGGAGGASSVSHVSTGGTTPSLTLPLATAMDTALPNLPVGGSFRWRCINSNSGTATIVTNTGWTTAGTLTLATNTWRDFTITKTAAGAYTITSVGTGTNS